MYHFYNQEKKSCFHFVKIKKKKGIQDLRL